MHTYQLTNTTELSLPSETATRVLNYLIRSFKPDPQNTLTIHQIPVKDPEQTQIFLLHFEHSQEDTDMTTEIPAYLHDLDFYCNMEQSDWVASTQCDYSHGNSIVLLTLTN